MKIYRAGLVGCGRMGATIDDEVAGRPDAKRFLPYSHAAAIVASDRTDLVAVCDPFGDKAEKIGSRYGVPKAYLNFKEMIDNEDLDIVAIATRPGPHAEIISYAAQNGVRGIYCEKPLCNAVHEMDLIREVCTKRKIAFNYGAQRRYMPVYAKVRELVADGAIGSVDAIIAHCGVSSAQWSLTHATDMLLYLAGDVPVKFVQGTMMINDEDWKGDILKRDGSICSGYISFINGIHAYLSASGGWEFEVSGSTGKLRIINNSLGYQMRCKNNVGQLEEVNLPDIEICGGTQRGIEDLAKAIDVQGQSLGSLDVACRSQEVIFGLAESHRCGGKRVEIPLRNRQLAIAPDNY